MPRSGMIRTRRQGIKIGGWWSRLTCRNQRERILHFPIWISMLMQQRSFKDVVGTNFEQFWKQANMVISSLTPWGHAKP